MDQKTIRPLLWTLLCAIVILAAGYAGIVWSGRQVLEGNSAPKPVDVQEGASNLFYSQLEDDIKLSPWNYYPQAVTPAGDTLKYEMSKGWDEDYEVYNYNEEVVYCMIAEIAGVHVDEVHQWYDKNQRSIYGQMVMYYDENSQVNLFFYQDELELAGVTYQVKLSCTSWMVLSFSCISVQEGTGAGIEEWEKNREELVNRLEENTMEMKFLFQVLNEIYSEMSYGWWSGYEVWYNYVQKLEEYKGTLHQEVTYEFNGVSGVQQYMLSVLETAEKEKISVAVSGDPYADMRVTEIALKLGEFFDEEEQKDVTIQAIELPDSILLVSDQNITMGIYIDVATQKIAGFHFFEFMY